MAQVTGIRKVLAEQSAEGAIVHLAERVEALEAQVRSLVDVLNRTAEPAKPEEEV